MSSPMHTKQAQGAKAARPAARAAPGGGQVRAASLSRLPRWALGRAGAALPVQPKLTVNQPGDAYEQEADQVADQVMRMPDQAMRVPAPLVQRACACGGAAGPDGACEACKAQRMSLQRQVAEEEQVQRLAVEEEEQAQRQALDEDEAPLAQLKPAPAGGGPAVAPPSVHHAIRGPARPLDAGARAFLEPRFGQDFGHVRVHTDSLASASARAIGARAYTVGRDMVFGAGQYAPGSGAGRRLLAHELAHVMQQSAGPGQATGGLLQRARSYSDCSTTDKSAIETAAVQAETDLDTAITALKTRPLTAHVSDALYLAFRSNTTDTADAVQKKLQAIRDGLPKVSMECEDSSGYAHDFFCPPGTYGYVRPVGWVIHLCIAKFLSMAPNSQARAIVHESSHFFTSTSDEGYLSFPDCGETGQTAGDPPADRLDNADSYACLVHYLAHGSATDIARRARSYEGAQLALTQSTAGTINLQSGTPKDPFFEVTGVPGSSGFVYRWVIDVGGDRYRMWSDSGSVFHYNSSTTAYIPSKTRALMSSEGITSGKVLCRVQLWRPSFAESNPPTVLLELPVTFTP